jgi:carboxyl-terminal processing protease
MELSDKKIDGLVIDLRDNGGGSLQEANELTGLFIEYGPTVQIKHSSKRIWRDGKRKKGPYYQGPLLVMINRLSASASEIFSGAIQDYGRGIIVGDRSFGKGTVQTLIPLAAGQLKITESKFYRVSGASTQDRGVVPDIIFPSIYNSEEIGESALDYALEWDQINPAQHRSYGNFSEVMPYIRLRSAERTKRDPDFTSLRERVIFSDENRTNKQLSLNESDRKVIRSEREARALRIENKRRNNKGLELINTIDQLNESENTEVREDENLNILLHEAGNILTDLIIFPKRISSQTTQSKLILQNDAI